MDSGLCYFFCPCLFFFFFDETLVVLQKNNALTATHGSQRLLGSQRNTPNYSLEKVRKALCRQDVSIKTFSLEVRKNTTQSIPKMKKRVKFFESKIRIIKKKG